MNLNHQPRPKTTVPGYELTNAFFHISQLKQRIQMLTKPGSPRRALWRYALVLPIAGALLMCTQVEKEMDQVVKGKEKLDQSLKLNQVDGEIFMVVEQQPEFAGGMKELGKYLGENIRYPAAAQKANVQGRVFVNFVVTKTGDIADVKILKGIGYGCDEESIRVVSRMPNWTPGSQDGKPVNVRYNLPINFALEE
jgi:TonB family protein